MGIGRDTLHRAYRLICDKGMTTRKELAELLEASDVSAGKAAGALVDSGLISVSKDTILGRKTDIFIPSQSKRILLIDACRTNISFTLTPVERSVKLIQTIPHIHRLDIDSNLTIVASDIARFLDKEKAIPDVVAVAYAPVSEHPVNTLLTYALKHSGIKTDLMISGSVAACEYCTSLCGVGETFAFTQVNNLMWGCVSDFPDRMLDWRRIKVGNHHGESMGSVLSYDTDPEHLLIYFKRFFTTVDSVVSPDRIFISSSYLPEKMLQRLSLDTKVENLSSSLPVMNGLFSLAKDKLFEKTFFKN